MAWVRVDDAFYDHPKFHDVNALGVAMWVTGLAWSNRNLTDGFIPRTVALRLLNLDDIDVSNGMQGRTADPDDAIGQLLDAEVWELADKGYQIVNYLEFQPSAEKVKGEREAAKARMADLRAHKRASSSEVRANESRTSPEVRSTPTPTPTQDQNTRATRVAPNLFDAFWSIYPRKVGKSKAAKAWATATRTTSPDRIIEGATRYRDDPNREAAFTAHPTTWLTRGGWDDDPIPAKDKPGPPPFRPSIVQSKCPEHTRMTQPCATCAAERAAGLRKDPA